MKIALLKKFRKKYDYYWRGVDKALILVDKINKKIYLPPQENEIPTDIEVSKDIYKERVQKDIIFELFNSSYMYYRCRNNVRKRYSSMRKNSKK